MTIVVSHAARSAVDARVGLRAPLRPLELERQRDDADGERAELARDPRDDRRGAGAGAAALARGDEDHVAAAERGLDLVVRLLGGAAADLGIGARAEALRELAADVDLRLRVRHLQLLDVRVDGDELDLRDAGVHHPVQRVQAGAADADDADHREVRRGLAARRADDARRRLGQRVLRGRRQLRLGRRRLRLRRLRGSGSRLRHGRGRDDVLDRLLPGRDVLDRLLVRLLGGRVLLAPLRPPPPASAPPRSRGRAPRAGPHASTRAFAPLRSTSFARSRYISAASLVGSYLSTDSPFTGASA